MAAGEAPDEDGGNSKLSSAANLGTAGITLACLWTAPTTLCFERRLRESPSQLSPGCAHALVQSGIAGAWSLTQARPRVTLGAGVTESPSPVVNGSGLPQSAYDDWSENLSLLGPPPTDTPVVGSCLASIVHSSDTIHGEDVNSVRGYDPAKLNLLRDSYAPVNVLPLLDSCTHDWFYYAEANILKKDSEIDHEAIAEISLYTDPAFSCYQVYLDFVRQLRKRGVIVYRLTRRSTIGIFFVDKKSNFIRMVLDCRVTNALCVDPPHTFLTTPTALVKMRIVFDDAVGKQAAQTPELSDGPYTGRISVLDLVDSFYQLGYEQLSDFFAFEETVLARDVSATTALDEHGKSVHVTGDTALFACFSCMAMGWSHSLFACHSLLVQGIVLALSAFGLGGASARERIVTDGRCPPPLEVGKPLCFPYVDNGNAWCWDDYDSAKFWHSLSAVFDSWGMAYRVECESAESWCCVGLTLHAGRRLILGKKIAYMAPP
jgi:hypothetical protein